MEDALARAADRRAALILTGYMSAIAAVITGVFALLPIYRRSTPWRSRVSRAQTICGTGMDPGGTERDGESTPVKLVDPHAQ